MAIMLDLSALALRSIVDGALQAVGMSGGEAVVRFLTARFTDHSLKLTNALQTANERAWKSLEVALAGESLWERCKVVLVRAEEQAFREQVRLFLEESPLKKIKNEHRPVLRQAHHELRSARARGVLTQGNLAPGRLAQQAGAFANYSDPQALLDAEWKVIHGIALELRETCPNLYRVLGAKMSPNILVVAVRYYFRRQIETDEALFRGLAFAKLETLQATQERALAALTDAMSQQGHLLEGILGEIAASITVIAATTEDTNLRVRNLEGQIHTLLQQLQLQNREVRPSDSMSLRNDGDRQKVRSLVAEYRDLPHSDRQQRPGLLNDVGKLEVVSGEFEAAQRDFEALATLVDDPKKQAEARHNAYRAALERRQWDDALVDLRQAAKLDSERFAPFPLSLYTPQRILGAGGFGVVFLCQSQHRSRPVVVKSLLVASQGRDIKEVFAEADVLESLDHSGIIRVLERGYADAAGTRPYLVMDYFEGKTLAEYVTDHGPLTGEDFLLVARQVAEALQAAHGRGVLHRDVKPGNVLIRREASGWKVKLIDFGLAVQITPADVETSVAARTLLGVSIAGTIGYAAPEQMGSRSGEKVGQASDVYGFARTCCFALFLTPEPLRKQWAQLPHHLCELLEQCLAPAPKDRPADFTEVLTRLAANPQNCKGLSQPTKGKPVLELQGTDAAALDDLCAADIMAKRTDKYQKEKKGLAEQLARARALQLWFQEKAQPDNPSLRTASSQAKLMIKAGTPPPIPPREDGSPTPVKDWLIDQGLAQNLAERVAANEPIQSVTSSHLVGFEKLLAGSPEQQAAAKKLAVLLVNRLLPLISSIQFVDGGEQLRELLAQHFSPAEQQSLHETETTTLLPEDIVDRAALYSATPEELDQLLTLFSTKFFVRDMKYVGSLERATETLLRG